MTTSQAIVTADRYRPLTVDGDHVSPRTKRERIEEGEDVAELRARSSDLARLANGVESRCAVSSNLESPFQSDVELSLSGYTIPAHRRAIAATAFPLVTSNIPCALIARSPALE